MTRKLILTPYEHGYFDGFSESLQSISSNDKNESLNVAHIILSSITMAGVDEIHTLGKFNSSDSKLIKKVLSDKSTEKWARIYQAVESIFAQYYHQKLTLESKKELDRFKNIIRSLFFAMQSNSGILTFSDIRNKIKKELIPIDVYLPVDILLGSINTIVANLPVIKQDIEKRDIQKLIDVLQSNEFRIYKEAHTEIEKNLSLTTKHVRTIEFAGKQLQKKYFNLLQLKEGIVKALPLTSKVVELFFGKLPGMLSDYSSNIILEYLKLNKTVTIYNCENVMKHIITSSIRKRIE